MVAFVSAAALPLSTHLERTARPCGRPSPALSPPPPPHRRVSSAPLSMRAPRTAERQGFVSCKRCGTDVPISLTPFARGEGVIAVTCPECRTDFEADAASAMALDGGDIVPVDASLAAARAADPRLAATAAAAAVAAEGVKLYVGGLPPRVDGAALERLFEPYGDVLDAVVVSDRDTRRSRGFGFVTLRGEGPARAAAESLNAARPFGRKMSVRPAEDGPRR